MAEAFKRNFSDDNICEILLKIGLISDSQNKEIFVRKNQIKSKLQQIRAMRGGSNGNRRTVCFR